MTFKECADTVQIYANTMDMNGASPPSSSLDGGLELYGRNIYVQNNTIQNYPWSGVGAASTYNLHVENNSHIMNNSTQNQTGGVLIEDLNAPACDQVPRDTQGVTISGNNISGQPDGVKFGDRARNTINGVSMSGNIIAAGQYPIYIDNPIAVVSGTINGYPCPGANCATTGPTPGNDPPRALTPDAVGSAAPPIVTARCPAAGQGNAHETFGFSASDVKGPGHLTNLEVMFSIGGADKTGSGGPDSGAQGCHLLYITSPTNMLYLDGPNGGYHWDQGGNSVVGSNGKDITNTYCTVHAGSSVSKVWTEPYILDLQLDIEFLNSQSVSMNKHIYIVTVNQNAPPRNVSNAGAWTYYGWWSTP